MRDSPGSSGRDDAPYFFLAYAHTSEQEWVKKLYRDLSTEIRERTAIPPTAQVGFMDDLIPLGADWRDSLHKALATCRVFVPLYSPRYFQREECGREWHAFRQRMLDHRARYAETPSAIVPVLWTPTRDDEMADAARAVQFDHAKFGAVYAEEGFYTIIKNDTYRDAYTTAVQRLAKQIIKSANESRLTPTDPESFRKLHNAFAQPGREIPGDRRLTVTVVAPTLADLPDGRDTRAYGNSALDWNPYHPVSRQPLGEYASELARLYWYEPTAVSIEEGFDVLMNPDPAAGLGILLVDVWAAGIAGTAELLRRFDGLDKGWVATMVPWNRLDGQTQARRAELADRLRQVLGRRLADAGTPSVQSPVADGLATIEDFRSQLPQVLEAALHHYLASAAANPPRGEFPLQPRLRGPEIYPGGSHG